MQVRDATPADGLACAELYAPYVRDTAVTFELEPPSAAEMAERIALAQREHAWLVAEDGDGLVGYAYAGPFKARPAYRWACEVSVYIDAGRRRSGAGRKLYEALLARLRERGFRRASAGMTLPNQASQGLHAALGFVPVGTFHRVGWKHGAWHDVAWTELDLGGDDPPEELR